MVGRHRKPRDYTGRHVRPRRLPWLGPAATVLALTAMFLAAGSVTQARASWAAQVTPSASTFTAGTYAVPETVDIGIAATASSETVKEDDDVVIAVTVENLGTVTTLTSINSDAMAEPFDITLEPGELVTLNVPWVAPRPGEHTVEFIVLAADDVDSANNLASVRIVVQK